nr:selenocysteine insertion sequence-binding protein 2-like [Paramormyrops kingsleyae]
MDAGDHKAVQLSAEVEPFVPDKRGLDPSLVAMGLSGEVGGAAPEGPPIPSYLITCYPFVQENQPSRPLPLYGGDSRWVQPSPSHSNPYMAYHLLSPGQTTVPSDYAYYHLVPASCPPLLGFYPSFPSGYGAAPVAAHSAVITDCGDLPLALGQAVPAANQRAKAISRATALPKQQPMYQPQRGRRAPSRSVVAQKEVPTFSPDGRPKAIMLVDAAQQTDLPGAVDGASASPWKSRARRRRVGHLGFEPSGEQGASEADIDSDSGYCSPKHVQAAAASHGATAGVEAAVMMGVSWLGVASQRPWGDRNGVCHREGRVPSEQRAYSQCSSPDSPTCSAPPLTPPRAVLLPRIPHVALSSPAPPYAACSSPDSPCPVHSSPDFPRPLTVFLSACLRYCNQVLNKEIDESATLLLQELVRFQERVYQRDPSKAKSKRRLVMGLREVTKHMKLLKIKCVIISPNCEKIQAKGGLDEALYNVIAMAREQEIPFVFALGRKALGRCVNKLVPVSVVGIFNFSGAEELFHKLVSLTEEARQAYRDMVSALEQEQAEEALRSVRKLPHHMGHSRNPSAASAISFCSVISEPISEVNEQEYETNWRNMVESSDVQEPAEGGTDREPGSRPAQTAVPGQPRSVGLAAEREEGRLDDSLECASQHSAHCTETGSLDGSGRDPHSSSITSTASTLVPGMLEEGEEEEEEEEEEEDYTHGAVSLEVPPLSSRIESWVSETLENLQLQEIQNSSEDEHAAVGEGVPSEEELDAVELSEPTLDYEEQQLDAKGGSL